MSQIQEKINFYHAVDKIIDLSIIIISIGLSIISENYYHGKYLFLYDPKSFDLSLVPLSLLSVFISIIP